GPGYPRCSVLLNPKRDLGISADGFKARQLNNPGEARGGVVQHIGPVSADERGHGNRAENHQEGKRKGKLDQAEPADGPASGRERIGGSYGHTSLKQLQPDSPA